MARALVLNSGSSSLKCSLLNLHEEFFDAISPVVWEGQIVWGHNDSVHTLELGTSPSDTLSFVATVDRATIIRTLFARALAAHKGDSKETLLFVGHRIVHGGAHFLEPTILDDAALATLQSLIPLAPRHLPSAIELISLAMQELPAPIPHIGVFDTAFHQTIPRRAAQYAGPYDWYEGGIRRYGFHGLSHQYCSNRTAELFKPYFQDRHPDLVVCHLGSGCSISALRSGRSVDTSMGYTPLEGLMMGTRSGSIDPSILFELMRSQHASSDTLETILNERSGLLGISGISADVREILAARSNGNERASLAIDMFTHSVRRGIGQMVVSLGHFDGLVFTGGIGEHSAEVRSLICGGLQQLGVTLDSHLNEKGESDRIISLAAHSPVVFVIESREDLQIANECLRLLRGDWQSDIL